MRVTPNVGVHKLGRIHNVSITGILWKPSKPTYTARVSLYSRGAFHRMYHSIRGVDL